jgi:hypothetical protein
MTIIHDPTAAPFDRIPRGGHVVFGAVEAKPIVTALSGRFRCRMRNGDFTSVFVRDDHSFRAFLVVDFGDHWQLVFEHGANVRYRPQ